MSVVRVIFLGTPDFAKAHLEALLEDEHFDVVGVVSQPDRPAGRKLQLQPSAVKELATSKGIPVFTPEKMNSEAIEKLKALKAEAAIVVAYGQILPQDFLDLFPDNVVNVHGSLLPKWRGAAPIQRSIMAGESETGVCLQVMVQKLDAGPILGTRKIQISSDMSAMDLHDKMIIGGRELLHLEFMDYLRGHLAPRPQNEINATYAHKLSKEESFIDWSWPAQKIQCHIRGMQMGPGTYTNYKGKKIKIHKASVVSQSSHAPGVVSLSSKSELIVSCGVDALSLEVVQAESKPKMDIEVFLRGTEIKTGETFGE